MLNETYNISIKKIKKADGTSSNYAYIDPQKSTDDTRAIKDGIKAYGAKWDPKNYVWGWYLSNDPEKLQYQLNKFVYPAIEFLNSRETPPENGEARTADSMKTEFNKLLQEIDNFIVSPISEPEEGRPMMDEETLKKKLTFFKEELVETMSSQEFLDRIEPIIKFRNAQGHQLSFFNSMLILLQDPNAKMCKNRKVWRKIYKREVLPNAPSLCVSVPDDERRSVIYASKEEKDAYTAEYLKSLGKKSKEELTPGEKDILRVNLLKLDKHPYTNFKYAYTYYDVRFTKNIGEEDLVGNMDDIDKIEWSDETSEPTETTIKMYDAMLQIIPAAGIQLGFVDDLGGAKGVSKSGSIDVLKNTNKNAGAVSTLIHEFSHELLHQKYLQKSKNSNNEWAKYFIGKEQGRAVVEQQAEMSAYLVMRFFGFQMQQNINYMGIWGADEKKAAVVFDTVAKVADNIARAIATKLGYTMNENVNDGKGITGRDVAELLGPKGIRMYDASRESELNETEEMIQETKKNFWNFYNRINSDLY